MPFDAGHVAETAVDVRASSSTAALVLVVDDNVANRVVAERMLNLRGCDVVLAPNGAVAVELVRQQQFDAIFMDCHMPVLDGYAATRQIRAQEQVGRIPIVAMTASVMPADREAATAAGMDDFLAKPVSLEAFTAVIDRWVRPTERHGPPAETAESPDAEKGQVLDRQVIAELTEVYPAARLPNLLQTFRTQGRGHLDEAVNAHASDDRAALREAAHALRGSSLTLGATRLAAAAAAVEQATGPAAHLTDLLQRLQHEWTVAVDALSATLGSTPPS